MHQRRQPPVLAGEEFRWGHFDAYSIVDGMLRPKSGAKLTTYALGVPGVNSKDLRQAYEELVLAVRDMKMHPAGWLLRRPLTSREEEDLLGFCARYGLLGLLPHQVRSVVLTARQRDYVDEDGFPYFIPYQVRYVRTARGWVERSRALVLSNAPDPGDLDLGFDAAVLDDLTDEADDPDIFEMPRAFVQQLGQYDEEAKAIEDAIWPYFPSIPKADAKVAVYPRPGTDRFWAMYSEPLDGFLQAAVTLARMFENVSTSISDSVQANLDSLLAPVTHVVSPGERRIPVQKVATPSLLSALAMEAISAANGGRRLARCAACEMPFFTDAYQRRYHLPKCAARIHARTFRARKKAKEAAMKAAEEVEKARKARQLKRNAPKGY